MKQIILPFCLIGIISCKKNNIEKPQIDGSWIETNHMTDTLVFDNQSSDGIFILNRGNEIRNGYV